MKFPLTLVAVTLAAAYLLHGGSHAASPHDGGVGHPVALRSDMGVGPRDQEVPRLVHRRASRERRSMALPQGQATRSAHRSDRLRRVLDPSAVWARTWAAVAVKKCESGRDGSWNNHYGAHRGYWQMDADFWRTYGGLEYASYPDYASESEQDEVAYRGFLARGWEPWTCARIVGVYP